jgi:hypothetical protein
MISRSAFVVAVSYCVARIEAERVRAKSSHCSTQREDRGQSSHHTAQCEGEGKVLTPDSIG